MTRTTSSYPSIKEMEARIMRNIERLQGYLDVLSSEIEDPEKEGPGASKADWKKAVDDLETNIKEFKKLLQSKNWGPSE